MTDTSNISLIDWHVFKVTMISADWKAWLTLNKGVSGTLFGLAIITGTTRTIYRVRSHRRLLLDDWMFIFACVTLTAANGIFFSLIPLLDWEENIAANPRSQGINLAFSSATSLAKLIQYRKLTLSFYTLTWMTIFAVKICFLVFFLQIVGRLPNFMFVWKNVFAITMLSCCFCTIGTLVNCPHYGGAISKSSGSSTTHSSLESSSYSRVFFIAVVKCKPGTGPTINLALTTTAMALDITTDLLSKFLTVSFWLE